MVVLEGTYIQLAERSSLAKNFSICLGGGVVDRGFTGKIQVILQNLGDQPFNVKVGQRFAQAIVQEICKNLTIEEVQTLPTTDCGKKGFGSSDKAPKKQKVATIKEDKWCQNIADGFAPHGRCPHSIAMYCMKDVSECHACISEIFRINNKKHQKAIASSSKPSTEPDITQ